MRILGIDYGDARTGIAITDALNITVQGLETIHNQGSDRVILRRLDEILEQYEVDTIVIGKPINMNGTPSERTEITEKFIHKLKCKYNKIKIETIDERLTTVAAHKTMNFLDVNKNKKRNIVDTISAVYILETYFSVKLCTKVSHPLKHQLFSFSFVCLPPYPLTVNTCLTEVMQTIHILRPIFPTLQPLQGFCSSLCRFR